MAATLILVVDSIRLPDDEIGFRNPPIIKVCSLRCLAAWLSV